MKRVPVGRILAVVAFLLVRPSIGAAQSTIAGVDRDTSGAVLPGVTVEASSPVLIEKTRSVVTDATAGTRSSISGPAPMPSSSR
jgi:hypothetical protein